MKNRKKTAPLILIILGIFIVVTVSIYNRLPVDLDKFSVRYLYDLFSTVGAILIALGSFLFFKS